MNLFKVQILTEKIWSLFESGSIGVKFVIRTLKILRNPL